MSDDDQGPMAKLIEGYKSVNRLFQHKRWSEIFIRVAIFVGLTVLVHAIYVWILYSVLIPILQTFLVDSLLVEVKKRLEVIEENNFKLSDIQDL